MKISVLGAGHIGLSTSLSFAHFGHEVLVLDVDSEKIALLSDAKTQIFEPGLEPLLKNSLLQNKISFSTDYGKIADFSDLIFICIGTPTRPGKGCDLTAIDLALDSLIATKMKNLVVVIKSTVPPGTTAHYQQKFQNFHFVSSPEFLREGQALQDAIHPDRVVVGGSSKRAVHILKELYRPFLKSESDFIEMDSTSAELSKYAANSFLAARISLINEFSVLCEKFGADIESVATALGKDHRIGPHFLKAGIGYGGSCFPKDIEALIYFSHAHETETPLLKAVQMVNENQIQRFIQKIKNSFAFQESKLLTLWGVAFKPETNDIREAPSLKIVEALLLDGFSLQIYDPVSNREFESHFKMHPQLNQISFFDDKMQALKNSSALAILTEWNEFRLVSLEEIQVALKNIIIFDGRNLFSKQVTSKNSRFYHGIGIRPFE